MQHRKAFPTICECHQATSIAGLYGLADAVKSRHTTDKAVPLSPSNMKALLALLWACTVKTERIRNSGCPFSHQNSKFGWAILVKSKPTLKVFV